MARRTAVEEVPDIGASTLDDAWEEPPRRAKKSWGGGGGRWLLWIGRALLWTFVIVVVVNGIRAPFERFTAKTPQVFDTQTQSGDPQFPVTAGSAFALEFAGVYLNYSAAGAGDRQKELAYFLPEGADAQFGWDGLGQLSADHLQVVGTTVRDEHHAVVDVLAKLGDRWSRLAVPVYADGGKFVVSGEPALLEAPDKAQLPAAAGYEHDTDLENQLNTQLTGFFKAYGASDGVNLQRYTEGGAIKGLDSAVTFSAIIEVNAPKGEADERTVTATVQWKVPPTDARAGGDEGQINATYELSMVKKNEEWYVRSIRGAASGS